jgi:cytoskeletal protein CcmA (bactofilin family)
MSRTPLVTPSTHEALTAIIDAGCEFEGKLCFRGAVRIGGVFRGEIVTPDTLIVGEGARVQGEVDAGVVIISGELTGTVRAKHRVEIHSPARFRGEITTPSLKVADGVIFEGRSRMVGGPSQTTSPTRLPEDQNS